MGIEHILVWTGERSPWSSDPSKNRELEWPHDRRIRLYSEKDAKYHIMTRVRLFLLRHSTILGLAGWIGVTVAAIGGGLWLARRHWDELTKASNVESIQVVGFAIAATIAIWMAVWRGVLATRQANTSHNTLLNERYQDGAEMLGSKLVSVRLGGVYALEQLAREHPQQHHIPVMRLFSAFMRHPPIYTEQAVQGQPATSTQRDDIRAILAAILWRSKLCRLLENREYRRRRFRLDLSGAILSSANLAQGPKYLNRVILDDTIMRFAVLRGMHLNHASFRDADLYWAFAVGARLESAEFTNAKLQRAVLRAAHLREAVLRHADLSSADLSHADLSKAELHDATFNPLTKLYRTELSGAKFGDSIKGLTQAQLDSAKADRGPPPEIPPSALDALTGSPLEWRD